MTIRRFATLLCTLTIALSANQTSIAANTTVCSGSTENQPNNTRAMSDEAEHLLDAASPYPASTSSAFDRWQAGKSVSLAEVKSYGIDRCFTAHPISDAIFKRMNRRSFSAQCTIARSELRYLQLLHYTANGRILMGEMVCNKAIAADLISIFKQLFDARYAIERMQLIDDFNANDQLSMAANNTSCFCFRVVAGSKRLSNHSRGMAVDLNPLYNPYVKRSANGHLKVSPKEGKPYADRSQQFKHKIDHTDLAFRLFKQHGFRWGGDYRSLKDYQHFEK